MSDEAVQMIEPPAAPVVVADGTAVANVLAKLEAISEGMSPAIEAACARQLKMSVQDIERLLKDSPEAIAADNGALKRLDDILKTVREDAPKLPRELERLPKDAMVDLLHEVHKTRTAWGGSIAEQASPAQYFTGELSPGNKQVSIEIANRVPEQAAPARVLSSK